MGGDMLFEDSLKERLELMQPSRKDLIEIVNNNEINLSPNIEKVVELLHEKGIPVYLVSGGFRQMINPVAELLNIPLHRVYSNNILFDANGDYKGFDENALTSKDKGKGKVIELLKESFDYENVVMIGDGYTDLQARTEGPADIFINYCGVVERENVIKESDWSINDFQEIIDVFESKDELDSKEIIENESKEIIDQLDSK